MALVGEGDPVTDGLLEALRAGFDALDPRRIVPHSSCKATGCPGDVLRAFIARGAPRPERPSQPEPDPEEEEMAFLAEAEGHPHVYYVAGTERIHIVSAEAHNELRDKLKLERITLPVAQIKRFRLVGEETPPLP